jgi:hypothetical protein
MGIRELPTVNRNLRAPHEFAGCLALPRLGLLQARPYVSALDNARECYSTVSTLRVDDLRWTQPQPGLYTFQLEAMVKS